MVFCSLYKIKQHVQHFRMKLCHSTLSQSWKRLRDKVTGKWVTNWQSVRITNDKDFSVLLDTLFNDRSLNDIVFISPDRYVKPYRSVFFSLLYLIYRSCAGYLVFHMKRKKTDGKELRVHSGNVPSFFFQLSNRNMCMTESNFGNARERYLRKYCIKQYQKVMVLSCLHLSFYTDTIWIHVVAILCTYQIFGKK